MRCQPFCTVFLLAQLSSWSMFGALHSGVYQTIAGSTARETGDRLTNGTRLITFHATVTLDLNSSTPSITAFLANAVLEGGDPFPLYVQSASASWLADESIRFGGDYLAELHPSQYGFQWTFSPGTNGTLRLDGTIAWLGGHIWHVAISDVTLAEVPALRIASIEDPFIEIHWSATFVNYVLERAGHLRDPVWTSVSTPPTTTNGFITVRLDKAKAAGFYRLRPFLAAATE